MGLAVKDIDVMVVGNPSEFVADIEKTLGLKAVRHARFGTHVFPGLDVALSRSEVYENPGELPKVRTGVSVERDLARRDFTVNAMALDASSTDGDLSSPAGKIIDPFGGGKDIERGLLRALHEKSFFDDPTRIIRAARFAARFAFSVEEATLSLIRCALDSGAVGTLSAARIGKELELLSREPEPLNAYALLDSWDAAKDFFPEFDNPAPPSGFLIKYNIPRSRQKNVLDFVGRLRGKNPPVSPFKKGGN
jgi:tRNA nucleotidyltransferase (CCA-adding enzyme)